MTTRTAWSISNALRDIDKGSRPRAVSERQASSRGAYLVKLGLARRTGCVLKDSGSVAEYELTPEGRATLADSASEAVGP